MANELTLVAAAGLTVTARLMQGATQVGASVAMAESGTAGYYTGSVPGGVAAGRYSVLFLVGGVVKGCGELLWDGAAEVQAATATTLRAALATELARIDVAVSSREAESAAATRASTNQAEHDATQTAIGALGAASDPLGTVVPGSYAEGTAGAALGRLTAVPAGSPALVVPGAPAEAGMCRVYGYFETPDNKPAVGVSVRFTLVTAGLAASERLVAGREVVATTDSQGRLADRAGNAWIDLQRNDVLVPAGSYWAVRSDALKVAQKRINLTSSTADLRALLLA